MSSSAVQEGFGGVWSGGLGGLWHCQHPQGWRQEGWIGMDKDRECLAGLDPPFLFPCIPSPSSSCCSSRGAVWPR